MSENIPCFQSPPTNTLPESPPLQHKQILLFFTADKVNTTCAGWKADQLFFDGKWDCMYLKQQEGKICHCCTIYLHKWLIEFLWIRVGFHSCSSSCGHLMAASKSESLPIHLVIFKAKAQLHILLVLRPKGAAALSDRWVQLQVNGCHSTSYFTSFLDYKWSPSLPRWWSKQLSMSDIEKNRK